MFKIITLLAIVAWGFYVYTGNTLCIQLDRFSIPFQAFAWCLGVIAKIFLPHSNFDISTFVSGFFHHWIIQVSGALGVQC